jgi:hypothetical protein
MKFLRTAIVALFVSMAFVACKKDDVSTPSFKIEGIWDGKIGQNAEEPSGLFKLNIKAGGNIERISSNGSVSATGSWNEEDGSFTAIYFYSNGTVVDLTGTIDKAKNKLTGTWSNNGGEQGTFYVSKQ